MALIFYEIMAIQSTLHARNWGSTQSRKIKEFFDQSFTYFVSGGSRVERVVNS